MIRSFHSVMEIKRETDWASLKNSHVTRKYKETVTYDISGQMVHRLEFNWLKPKLLLEILSYTALFLIPAAAFLFVPIALIIQVLFPSGPAAPVGPAPIGAAPVAPMKVGNHFGLMLIVLEITAFIASFAFSFMFVNEKKAKALIRKERGLTKKQTNFAIVPEKNWTKWLAKLREY